MNARSTSTTAFNLPGAAMVLARWLVGGVFIYMGLNKAMHPADILVALRQYHLIEHYLLLNPIAAVLPWLEILCGWLLVAGVAVRGTAWLSLATLAGFSCLVLQRALALHAAGTTPFCAIRFDCGCGGGEVFVCRKLLENLVLALLSGWVLVRRVDGWCLRRDLIPGAFRPEAGGRRNAMGR